MFIKNSNSFGNKRFSLDEVLNDFVEALAVSKLSKLVILKGGLNLQAAVDKYNKSLIARPTVDVDLQIRTMPDYKEFVQLLTTEINNNSLLGITYQIVGNRGIERTGVSDSLKIATSVGEVFSIDINISDYEVKMELYRPNYPFGYSVETMLADKLKVFISSKIYRRSKDMYDIYLLAKVKNYQMNILISELIGKWSSLGVNQLSPHLHDLKQLEHAYSKLSGIMKKPPFNEVYGVCLDFTLPIYYRITEGESNLTTWDFNRGVWL